MVRMKRLFVILCFAIFVVSASAQETVDDYYRYKIDDVFEADNLVESDTLLFYRVSHSRRDLFEEVTAYRFSFAEYARRGFYFAERTASVDGVALRRSNISILRRLGLSERGYAGVDRATMNIGGMAGVDEFSTMDGVPVAGVNSAIFFSGKGYLGGVRATANMLMRKGWSATLYAAARGGDDMYVKGVYNNSVDAALRLTKNFQSGGSFSLVALTTVGERGLRSGSTQEAFTLTGDNLYNPSWGRQANEVRNSRTRRDALPFAVATLSLPIGDITTMQLSVGGDYGQRAYSSLGWYDAMTPRADNYRYMPSYYADSAVAEVVADAWRRQDERYTQVDWAELYSQNRISSDGAVYALEQRVERIARADAVLRFQTLLGEDLTLNYGVRGSYNSSRNFKQMDDLLGATHLVDIDYYLIDDDTFSRHLQNDLRNPDRAIGEGDRFSYDYELVEKSLMADVNIKYASDRWLFDLSLLAGSHSVYRRGYFEKELFSGNGSYGRSREVRFSPYTVKLAAGYSLSPRHYLGFGAMIAEVAPDAKNLFLNPLYNNRLVDNPDTEHHLAAEATYRFTSSVVDFSLTAYYAEIRDERQTFRAYDDLSTEYADVDISGLGTLRYGVEAAAQVRLSSSWRLSAAAAAGRYIYSKNPLVSHYSDTDNTLISSSSESYVGDCTIGGAPQLSGMLEATYLTYRGWSFSCSVQGVAMRYVDPSFIRRTERVAIQGSASEEIYRSFLSQQRLNDAVTVDASISRWFNIGESRLSLTLMANNLLGNSDIVYGGYESSRIRNYRSGDRRIYAPQDDVLTYAYPRSFYAVVSWKF